MTQSEAMAAVTSRVAPEYPAMARQLKLAGTVTMEVLISESGTVESVTAVNGNPVLTKAAGEAIKKWRFKPFVSDGAPAKAQAQIMVDFARQ